MKKILVILLFLNISPLQAQRILTLGLWFSASFYDAKEMNIFSNTYNFVNQNSLRSLLQGFNGAEGLRFEAGYRDVGRTNWGAIAGFQFFTRKNNAAFNNGEVRNLELKWNSFYTEFEIGRTWNIFFLNGLLGFNFNRKLKIKSNYLDRFGDPLERLLNGNYKNSSLFTADAGFAIGFYRRALYLSLKFAFPVFITNRSKVFRDKSPVKIAEGSDRFPDDYIFFLNGEDYQGVSNEFNGLKVTLAVSYAIQLNKEEKKKKRLFSRSTSGFTDKPKDIFINQRQLWPMTKP